LVGGAGNDILAGGIGDDVYVFDCDTALGSDTVDDGAAAATPSTFPPLPGKRSLST